MTENKRLSTENIGQICFYIGLCLEILILILDKSTYINPFEGQMFRISFLFFALKLCLTKYTMKEWGAILAAGGIAAVCYLLSTRDEAVRVVVFVAAMKNVDAKRAMKLVFWGTIAGLTVLAGLAFAGILGSVYELTPGYGIKEGAQRLCLGVGNSNALACMIWALMTLGIYLYHEKMKIWHYFLLAILTWLTYRATLTRTTFLVMVVTLIAALVMQYVPKLQQAAWLYDCGALAVLSGVGFSVYAAHIADRYGNMPEWVLKLERLLTGRISSICDFTNGGGVLANWRLFGKPTYIEYFDMGYIRLFFWYGIVPGIGCVLALLALIWACRKQKDYMGFVLVMSFAVYTVVEAHIVSVYIARNYLLLLMGAYWVTMLGKRGGREAYWWRGWELFGKKR